MPLEYPSFKPVKRDKVKSSLIGFVSFKWGNEFQFQDIGVHRLLHPANGLVIRLLYPKTARPKGIVYQEILKDVNSYVVANYLEHTK